MPNRDEFDDPEGFFSRLITVKDQGRASIFDYKSLWISVAVFSAVVALSGVIWASYPGQNPLVTSGAVPIIRADAAPYKVLPDDRGGMNIAHQDSTIFEAMRGGNDTGARVENLLSDDTEKPVDRAVLFAGLKTDLAEATQAAADAKNDAAAPVSDLQVARMGDLTQERPMTEAERRAAAAERNQELLKERAQPLPGTDTAAGEKNTTDDLLAAPPTGKGFQEKPLVTPEPAVKKPVETAKPTPAKPTETARVKPVLDTPPTVKTGVGNAYVQVASVPSEALVKSEWGVVSSKLPMVRGLPYRVQRADLGAKGVFHRIQVGPMSSDDAGKLCAAIKAQKPGGCLVVR